MQQRSKNPKKLAVQIGGHSTSGRKSENQDAFTAHVPTVLNNTSKGVVAAMADGVSSANFAKQAAQSAVTQFTQDFYATPLTWSTKKSAKKVIASLNSWMFAKSDNTSSEQQWLTTLSALIIKSTTGYIFHAGDTRISLIRNDQLTTLTRDHNQKHAGKHFLLTRALGADYRMKVDVHQLNLMKNDLFLLSSDGFHEFICEQDIIAALRDLSYPVTNLALEACAQQLVKLAIANGSDDNVSCLFIFIESLPTRQRNEIEQQLLSKEILPVLEMGMKLDGYKIINTLYESTRSHLYLVQKENSVERLVLKVPSINFSDDPVYIQGFIREAWLGEQINHPNIMKIKAGSSNSQYLYHFCEHINGQTLSDWIYDNPDPEISQVRSIIKQLISALRAFQRLDVVHRDLKPENIMIDQQGHITLLDYGSAYISSITEMGEYIEELVPQGSLNYTAPETLLTLHADFKSDLFSLGTICYQLLTGELPFKPMARHQVLPNDFQSWQYRSCRQHRADLPLWLDFALEKATAANPDNRYQAFSEFEADLCKPNLSAVDAFKRQPILQRDPVLFWQGVSTLLFIILITVLV